jgi:hypothetical protein
MEQVSDLLEAHPLESLLYRKPCCSSKTRVVCWFANEVELEREKSSQEIVTRVNTP